MVSFSATLISFVFRLGSFKCPRHVNAPIRVIFRLVSFRARKKTSLLRIGSPVTSFAEATLWYFGWIVNSSASFHFSPVAFSSCIHFPRFFVLATVSLFFLIGNSLVLLRLHACVFFFFRKCVSRHAVVQRQVQHFFDLRTSCYEQSLTLFAFCWHAMCMQAFF